MGFNGLKNSLSNKADEIKVRAAEQHISLTVTAGKKNLNMNALSSSIVMRQNSNNQVYFDTMPGQFFILTDYTWEGPRYKTVSTSKEKGRSRSNEKEKRKGGLGGAILGTVLMPGIGTAIGYAMTSKKVKKGRGRTRAKVVVDENQVEIMGNASIQLKNVVTQETFSFGFECNSKIDVELDNFDWSNADADIEDIQSQADKIRLLKEYKELYDQNIISEEEFEQKKQELLS